jgi:hypothetical protein
MTAVETRPEDQTLGDPTLVEFQKALGLEDTSVLRMAADRVAEKSQLHVNALAAIEEKQAALDALSPALNRLGSESFVLGTAESEAKSSEIDLLVQQAITGKVSVPLNQELMALASRRAIVAAAATHVASVLIPAAEEALELAKIAAVLTESESMSAFATFRATVIAVRLGSAVEFDGGLSVGVGPETAEMTKKSGELYSRWRRMKTDFDERKLRKQNERKN